jgi:hypothetical protein
MNIMRTEKIKVEPVSFGTLMSQMAQGHLRVPRFQRNFVWEKARIQSLFDSMYKEYPIGTIFLWRAPSKYNHMLRTVDYLQQPSVERDQSYTLILDGQQRLTSLYVTVRGLSISGDDYGRIVVDLGNSEDGKTFLYRTPDNRRWIAIRDLVQENHFSLYDSLPPDYRQKFADVRQRLASYPFSVVTVSNMDLEDAIEIFERINQQSKRLTRYDLIAASVLTDSFDLRDRTQKDIIQPLKSVFGPVAETNIPQALALNIRKRTEHETQMSLETAEVQTVWGRTVECFKLAVDFVHSNLGVKRSDFLPYNAMLPVLAHYFYVGETNSILSPAHREQLERWFWRVAFSERYSGASQTRMTEDAAMMRALAVDNKPMDLDRIPVPLDEKALIQASMRSTTSALRNGILCLLNVLRPLHFVNQTEISVTGDYFSKFTRAERHHIFPIAFLQERGFRTRDIHRIPNFCFIPTDLNQQISNKAPSEYFAALREKYGDSGDFEKVMRTHLIPVGEDSGIWTDDYNLFLSQRARLLLNEIRALCGLSSRVPDELRNPIIDDIEVALRDLIHESLSSAYGLEYWKRYIPTDTRERVKGRIETIIKSTPGINRSQFNDPRKLLDQLDVSDYSRIILSSTNWPYFSNHFKHKPDTERMLNDFRMYRNAVKHNQQVDTLMDLRGQAAIVWLAQALNVDLSPYGIF